VCVSHAKVPIVKIWDPDLQLACDMNVNNTLALENTRMIKTYVDIDERVRPLAMIVKYWTKRRILNDAGALHKSLYHRNHPLIYTNILQLWEER
jgi:DNA polymerase sigma